jgi:hypothetical protein
MARLKMGKAHALIIEPLPPPLGVEGLTLSPMIVVDGVGVNVTNQPLVMEK